MIDWGQWGNEPLLAAGLIVLAWWCVLACPAGWGRWRILAGLLVAYLAVCAPWERIGRYYFFSVQMAEEMVLVYAAAGLVVSGLPREAVDRLLRRATWLRRVLHPVVCGGLFVLVVSAFCLPRLQEPALHTSTRMAIEHGILLLVGGLFWWPLLSPSRIVPRMRWAGRLVYLFGVEVALTGAFTYLLMAEHALYPTYELAPRVLPFLTAEDDQLLGGIVLSGISSAVMVAVLGAAFFTWAKESEKATTGRGKSTPAPR